MATRLKEIKPFEFYDELLYTTTWLYCGCSWDDMIEDIRKEKGIIVEVDKADIDFIGMTFIVPIEINNLYVIYIKKKRDIRTLEHEVIHLIFRLFKDTDIPIEYDNQEIFARYHTFYMDKLKGALR